MDAYYEEKVCKFKTLGISISCIATHGDTLLVVFGKELRKYHSQSIYDPDKNKHKLQWNCSFTDKVFDKPVMEMAVVGELDMLVVLTDSGLRIHNLDTYELRFALADTEGATLFDVSVQEEVEVTNNVVLEHKVRLCVALGKTIKVYAWTGSSFEETNNAQTQLKLPQPARALVWLSDKIMVGLKDEYIMLQPNTGKLREVVRYGSGQSGPVMTRMSRDEKDLVMLGYQNKALFVNTRGKPDRMANIEWTAEPHLMFHDPPYMIAAMTKHVEVNAVSPSMLVQQLDIRGVLRMRKASTGVFAQTAHSVHLLTPRPPEERVKYHRQHHQFELAIQIQLLSDLPQEKNDALVTSIQAQKGVHLFCEKKFKDAMDIFLKLNTDAHHVIGLFPDMLPHRLEYPERLPTLAEYEMHVALEALEDFLIQKRSIVAKEPEVTEGTVIYEHRKNPTLKTRTQALSVIDTTLLKCYVQTHHIEIVPLLRSPGNHVDVREAVRVLTKSGMYTELTILYEEHAMHAEILELLKSRAKVSGSPVDAIQPTIQKLQSLGVEHLSLIYEWAKWVFKENQFEALTIFTEDTPTVRGLPRGHILSYLERLGLDKMVPIQYLEHVIYKWDDVTEELHHALATKLREAVVAELENKRSLFGRVADDEPIKLGKATDSPLDDYRHKLLHFIKTSTLYHPEHVLAQLPMNCLFEERAALLGRMGRHDQALGIYVYVLKDLNEAEKYCNTCFAEGKSEVYLDLLRVYLHPPGPLSLRLLVYRSLSIYMCTWIY